MKRLLFILLIPILLLDCKKKTPAPDASIADLVGKWKLEAYGQTVNGQTVWENVDHAEPYYMSFRFDGVILDSKGLPACCTPGSFYLNGLSFKIIPKASLPENPTCAYVNCVGCDFWTIEQTGDEMIITLCVAGFPRSKYVRV